MTHFTFSTAPSVVMLRLLFISFLNKSQCVFSYPSKIVCDPIRQMIEFLLKYCSNAMRGPFLWAGVMFMGPQFLGCSSMERSMQLASSMQLQALSPWKDFQQHAV